MPIPIPGETIIGRVVWSSISAGWQFWRSLKTRLSPQKTLTLRAKWRPLFTEWLQLHNYKKLRTDVIIRDIKRMDSYSKSPSGDFMPDCRAF